MEVPRQSKLLIEATNEAIRLAKSLREQFVTPEHLLWAIAGQQQFIDAVHGRELADFLYDYITQNAEPVPADMEYDMPLPSLQLSDVIRDAFANILNAAQDELRVTHVVSAMFDLRDSLAQNALTDLSSGDKGSFMSMLIDYYTDWDSVEMLDPLNGDILDEASIADTSPQAMEWMQYVSCLNNLVETHNPLIGRDRELDRTIQVLCRKDKNNPLHVGEPGVGKTALAYGLAARINTGDVPERLSGVKIYSLDLGSMMAGTQYRGDMEKRLKMILDGVSSAAPDGVENILYIDEVHNIIGAGRVEGGTLDISNLLKPYLESGSLRFMGATTYEEFNRAFAKNKGVARRFEKIDIAEPSVEECIAILNGLKSKYEDFHGVMYSDEAIAYAVTGSQRYINGRFLPDKAIDLIDEAGAWAEVHGDALSKMIDKQQISQVLAKICNVDVLAEDKDDSACLESLQADMLRRVFGQDEAVSKVCEAVLMASAGLKDVEKPMASLLFVGPTGVGKTEVARVLADELSVPLIRFDMSEYAEKHTVAKLIGSPAGYVGYDDGGLLTSAVRKSPHCVLLLDELEKAHADIYNILLQVMDYGMLTDNKGEKTDFRHAVIIMTTNSGAQFARQASVGFGASVQSGEAMLRAVKKQFKPEFLNRLTDVTVFHDMTCEMSERILDKKLDALRSQLTAKHVSLELSADARALLIKEGFSPIYGGREIDRVINHQLKPLLMRAILFGNLREGGQAKVKVEKEKLTL